MCVRVCAYDDVILLYDVLHSSTCHAPAHFPTIPLLLKMSAVVGVVLGLVMMKSVNVLPALLENTALVSRSLSVSLFSLSLSLV